MSVQRRFPEVRERAVRMLFEWVDWFNHHRLREPIGNVSPAEFEDEYWRKEASVATVGLSEPSLR